MKPFNQCVHSSGDCAAKHAACDRVLQVTVVVTLTTYVNMFGVRVSRLGGRGDR